MHGETIKMIFVTFYKNVKFSEKEKSFFYCRIMNPSDLESIKNLKHHSLFVKQTFCNIPFIPFTLLSPSDSVTP